MQVMQSWVRKREVKQLKFFFKLFLLGAILQTAYGSELNIEHQNRYFSVVNPLVNKQHIEFDLFVRGKASSVIEILDQNNNLVEYFIAKGKKKSSNIIDDIYDKFSSPFKWGNGYGLPFSTLDPLVNNKTTIKFEIPTGGTIKISKSSRYAIALNIAEITIEGLGFLGLPDIAEDSKIIDPLINGIVKLMFLSPANNMLDGSLTSKEMLIEALKIGVSVLKSNGVSHLDDISKELAKGAVSVYLKYAELLVFALETDMLFNELRLHSIGEYDLVFKDEQQTKSTEADVIHQKLVFLDIPNDYWATPYISRLYNEKIIKGYDDGEFKPKENVSIGQFLAMSTKALLYDKYKNEIDATSKVEGRNFTNYIEFLHSKFPEIDINYTQIKNYSNNTLDEPATRGYVAKVLTLMLTYEKGAVEYKKLDGDWDTYSDFLNNKCVTSGKKDEEYTGYMRYAPEDYITRDEVSVLIVHSMKVKDNMSLSCTPRKKYPSKENYLDLPFSKTFKVTQGTDSNYSHKVGEGWDNLHALDFATPLNTQVLAPADGIITHLFDEENGGGCWTGGRIMVLTDNNNNKITFMHLNSFNKVLGDKVQRGDVIAYTGKSLGRNGDRKCYEESSVHLHMHLWTGTGNGRVDSYTLPFQGSSKLRVKIDNKIHFLEGDKLKNSEIRHKDFTSLQGSSK